MCPSSSLQPEEAGAQDQQGALQGAGRALAAGRLLPQPRGLVPQQRAQRRSGLQVSTVQEQYFSK